MSFNAKDMTRGGQIASMRIRMFSQIANIMLYCLFIFLWILVGLILWVKISWQTFVNGCIYWWCTTLEGMRDLISQYMDPVLRQNLPDERCPVLHDKYMIWCGNNMVRIRSGHSCGTGYCLITFFVVSRILGRQGKQQSENEVTGGRQLTDNPKDVARMLKKTARTPISGLATCRLSGIPKSRTSVCTARSGPVSRRLSVVWPTMPVSAVIWW